MLIPKVMIVVTFEILVDCSRKRGEEWAGGGGGKGGDNRKCGSDLCTLRLAIRTYKMF